MEKKYQATNIVINKLYTFITFKHVRTCPNLLMEK